MAIEAEYMRKICIYAALPLMLTACQSSMDRLEETSRVEALSQSGLPSLSELPPQAFAAQASVEWWRVFEDERLNTLVEKARVQSFDMLQAIAEVERAEAIVRGARASGGPLVQVQAEAGSIQPDLGADDFAGTVTNSLDVSMVGNWTIDLFGQIRNTVRSAESNLAASEAARRDVERLMIARTVQAYATALTVEMRLQLAFRSEARLIENTEKIQRLVSGGYATRLDLRRAETQLFELKARIAELEAMRTVSLNALALLTASPPDEMRAAFEAQEIRLVLPAQLPPLNLEQVMTNRPDIRRADWALASAAFQEDAARAGLYPNISLNGALYSAQQAMGEFPSLDMVSGSILSSLAAPLIGRGRLLAGVDQRSAEADLALIAYERTVLNAVLELDTAISKWSNSEEKLAMTAAALEAAVEAQELAERLFFAGEIDFTSLVVAEQSRLSAEDAFLVARSETLAAYVNYAASVVPLW